MNSKEIAAQAGFVFGDTYWTESDLTPLLERFAELVAEQEREECAKLCMGVRLTGTYFAELIRARSKA
jgi:hypothetical protein